LREIDPVAVKVLSWSFGGYLILLAIIEKRVFLNGVPTGIGEGWPEMDRSRGCADRKSCTGTWSAAGEVSAE
jgi:hypothetical protein